MGETAEVMTKPNRIEQTKQMWENSKWEDVEKFIGRNADKYQALWEKMRPKMIDKGTPGFVVGFCWSALIFLGLPWAIARKLYSWAAMALGVIILVNIFPIANTSLVAPVLAAAMWVKNLYLIHAVKKITQIDELGLTGPERDAAIVAAGGVNITVGVIAGLAILGISILLMVCASCL